MAKSKDIGLSKVEEYKQPTCPLRPVIPNNARPSCITAVAGTELTGTIL